MSSECTFNTTGEKYTKQEWAACYTCFGSGDFGACMYCIKTCHIGHDIGEVRTSNFYCDCGHLGICSGNDQVQLQCFSISDDKNKHFRPIKTGNCFDCYSYPSISCMHCLEKYHQNHDVGNIAFRKIYSCCCGDDIKKNGIPNADSIIQKNKDLFPTEFEKNPPETSEISESISQSVNLLAKKIYAGSEQSTIFSPAGIQVILTLLHLGSGENTADQITQLLGRRNSTDDLMALLKIYDNEFANMQNIFVANELVNVNPEYQEQISVFCHLLKGNFNEPDELAKILNQKISDNTKNLITDLIKPESILPNGQFVIANTVYFKAEWETKFEKWRTIRRKFNNNTEVPMMTIEKYNSYYEDDLVQIVELPYETEKYCMGFILPRLASGDFASYLCNDQVKFSEAYVRIHIPSFTQRRRIHLTDQLKKLGVTDLFNSSCANIDKICPGSYITSIEHETVIIVNENGTEASSATVSYAIAKCMKPTPKIFDANHSFIYYIKDMTTNMMIFVGDYCGN